jgi:hypothetical protein
MCFWRRCRRTWTHGKDTQVRDGRTIGTNCFSVGCECDCGDKRASERGAWECAGPPLALSSARERDKIIHSVPAARFSFTKPAREPAAGALLGRPTHRILHPAAAAAAAEAASSAGRVTYERRRGVSSANSLCFRSGRRLGIMQRENSNAHTSARRRLISLFWSKGGQGGGKLNDGYASPAALEWNESVHGCGFLDQFLFRRWMALSICVAQKWCLSK